MRKMLLMGAVLGLIGLLGAAEPVSVSSLLTKIKAVTKEGVGNHEAAGAWKTLAANGPESLIAILAAMEDDNLLASNWLRIAVDAIAERTIKAGGKLPVAELEQFIAKTSHPGSARRLAYEWLVRVDPAAPTRLLPGMLHDLNAELRRDAVALAIKDAETLLAKKEKEQAVAAFRKALSGACDQDQVDALAKRLKELGDTVDLVTHFGLVRTWHLLAPFDSTDGVGFAKPYPPEKGVDLKAVYKAKGEAEARWIEHTTDDPYGVVDLNKALGKQKNAVAYAYAVVDSPNDRLVQVRLGCINAAKIFLNGEEVFAREEYHHGMRLDQYSAKARLKVGRNELLLKICQNNQSEGWAQDWKFQVRLTDFIGVAVPLKVVSQKTTRK